MTALSLQTAEFDSYSQWKNRVLVQLLWKFERLFYPDAFSPEEVKPNTKWHVTQLTSQVGTNTWTFRVTWPGHEFEVYAKEFDR